MNGLVFDPLGHKNDTDANYKRLQRFDLLLVASPGGSIAASNASSKTFSKPFCEGKIEKLIDHLSVM